MEKNRSLFIRLYPEISNLTKDNPPIASFIIRVVSLVGDRKTLAHPGNVTEIDCFLIFMFVFSKEFCR